jgi:PDZ domain
MKRSPRDPRYLAVLALAAGLILLLGNWLRPVREAEEGAAQPLTSDSALLQLPRLTQRRSIEDRVEFVRQLVANLAPYTYRLGAAGQTAVLWNAATLVTARSAGYMPSPQTAAGAATDTLEASVTTAGPQLPLAILGSRLERPPLPLARLAATAYPEGSWALALWRSADGSLAWAEGQYLRSGRTNCGDLMPAQTLTSTIALTEDMAGAGIFNLDGLLVGVVGRCDKGLAILGTQAIELLFGRPSELADRLLQRYGMRLEQSSDEEYAALGAPPGLLVREVWKGYQAYAAGLRPGDVIAGIDGSELSSLDDLARLVLPVAQEVFELQVIAHGRKRNVPLRARPEVQPPFTPAGIILSAKEPGVLISRVAGQSPFAAMGAEEGDRLAALDGRAFEDSGAALRYLERARGPVWATLCRGERVWGALLAHE